MSGCFPFLIRINVLEPKWNERFPFLSDTARQWQYWDQNFTYPDVKFCAQLNEVHMTFLALLPSSKVCIWFIMAPLRKVPKQVQYVKYVRIRMICRYSMIINQAKISFLLFPIFCPTQKFPKSDSNQVREPFLCFKIHFQQFRVK